MTRPDEFFRVIGSFLVVVGWFVVLNVDALAGGAMSAIGDLLAVPYFVRTRAWDVVLMFCVLHSVTVHKVVQGVVQLG